MPVLDLEQLKSVTLDDSELMREILVTLIDDTSKQLGALERAVADANTQELARLAHYSKGACANVGAESTASILLEIERKAKAGDVKGCGQSLASLQTEFVKLRDVAAGLTI